MNSSCSECQRTELEVLCGCSYPPIQLCWNCYGAHVRKFLFSHHFPHPVTAKFDSKKDMDMAADRKARLNIGKEKILKNFKEFQDKKGEIITKAREATQNYLNNLETKLGESEKTLKELVDSLITEADIRLSDIDTRSDIPIINMLQEKDQSIELYTLQFNPPQLQLDLHFTMKSEHCVRHLPELHPRYKDIEPLSVVPPRRTKTKVEQKTTTKVVKKADLELRSVPEHELTIVYTSTSNIQDIESYLRENFSEERVQILRKLAISWRNVDNERIGELISKVCDPDIEDDFYAFKDALTALGFIFS